MYNSVILRTIFSSQHEKKSNFSVTLDTFQQFVKPIKILIDTSPSSWEEKQTKVTSNSTSNQSSHWFCVMIWRLKREKCYVTDWSYSTSQASEEQDHTQYAKIRAAPVVCTTLPPLSSALGEGCRQCFSQAHSGCYMLTPSSTWVKRERITHSTAPQAQPSVRAKLAWLAVEIK